MSYWIGRVLIQTEFIQISNREATNNRYDTVKYVDANQLLPIIICIKYIIIKLYSTTGDQHRVYIL